MIDSYFDNVDGNGRLVKRDTGGFLPFWWLRDVNCSDCSKVSIVCWDGDVIDDDRGWNHGISVGFEI